MELWPLTVSALCAALAVWLIGANPKQPIRSDAGQLPTSVASDVRVRFVMRLSMCLDRLPIWRQFDSSRLWPELVCELRSYLKTHGIELAQHSVAHLSVFFPFALACVATCISMSAVGFIVGIVAGCVALHARSAALRRTKEQALIEDMPRLLHTLAHALSSGQTMAQAIFYIASRERGAAQESFGRASLLLSCGASLAEALEELAASLKLPSARMLVNALLIAQRTGSPLHGILARTAQLAKRQGEFEQTVLVKTAQVRLSVRVVGSLPLIMVGFLALLSPDFRAGMLSPSGMACLCVAAFLDVCGLVVIRSMMRGIFA